MLLLNTARLHIGGNLVESNQAVVEYVQPTPVCYHRTRVRRYPCNLYENAACSCYCMSQWVGARCDCGARCG